MDDKTRESLRDFIGGKTTVTPGKMLAICRRAHNIKPDDLADVLMITTLELNDIENDRRPFPAMLMCTLFSYGLSAWYGPKTTNHCH